MSKEYSNSETTVVWQAEKCVHSGVCLMGLSKVFSLRKKPWINMEGATSSEIETQVAKCPSGALTIKGKENLREEMLKENGSSESAQVTITRGGPIIINGKVTLNNPNGRVWKEVTDPAFCRCGKSENYPFCDGSHVKH